ncbi:MAG: 16S rRNA (cytosine(1402)-N(4))-methyltransferase RsmH [Candidatus Binataceae bacterium]|jgi:16S rRNA (cytosine1402-N4)-methyltransferase
MRLAEEKGQSAASRQHVAVMLDEVVGLVRALNPVTIVDVTVGLGGHAAALLRATDAHLLGLDRDAAALAAAAANLAEFGPRVTLRQADFAGLDAVLEQCGIPCVSAIVADLGMSSFALNDADRGFSFRLDGPLDMRMDRSQQLRAYDIVNEETESELARIIFEYGEDRASRRIARAIVEARRRRPIETTGELSSLVEGVLGRNRRGGIHPATRTFQALRIAVNHELESLATLLDRGPAHLQAGGRMIVLAYHSLEDRPVKQCFRDLARGGGFAAVTRKALRPSAAEAAANPRARSARLRCIERVTQ